MTLTPMVMPMAWDARRSRRGRRLPHPAPRSCHLQPVGSFTVYVVVYEEGVTPGVGAGAGISAELGVGADATVPADDWTWSACTYNGDMDGPTPEIRQTSTSVATAPAVVGSYDYAGRVSIDGGPWLNRTWSWSAVQARPMDTASTPRVR